MYKVLKKIRWKYFAWSFFIGEYGKVSIDVDWSRVNMKVMKWKLLVGGN